MPDDDALTASLAACVDGSLTQEQAAFLASVLAAGGPDAEAVREHLDFQRQLGNALVAVDGDAGRRAVLAAIAASGSGIRGPVLRRIRARRRQDRSRRRWILTALAATMLAAVGITLWPYGDTRWVAGDAELEVAYGPGVHLRLAPGSVAVGEGPDRVRLEEGSLLAEIEPRPVPFAVDTRHGRATVLGTRFALYTLPEATRLDVLQGQVRLEGPGGSTEAGAIERASTAVAGALPCHPAALRIDLRRSLAPFGVYRLDADPAIRTWLDGAPWEPGLGVRLAGGDAVVIDDLAPWLEVVRRRSRVIVAIVAWFEGPGSWPRDRALMTFTVQRPDGTTGTLDPRPGIFPAGDGRWCAVALFSDQTRLADHLPGHAVPQRADDQGLVIERVRFAPGPGPACRLLAIELLVDPSTIGDWTRALVRFGG